MEFSLVSSLYFLTQGVVHILLKFWYREGEVHHHILYHVLVLSVMCQMIMDDSCITTQYNLTTSHVAALMNSSSRVVSGSCLMVAYAESDDLFH